MGKKKKPKTTLSPETGKNPRIDPSLKKPIDENPSWHLGTLDIDGPYGWNNVEKEVFLSEIYPKIKDFENRSWKEILNRNNKQIPIDHICPDAQKRLKKIHLDDIDYLVELRLMGKQRIWGILVRNILKIVWWDPEHQVCPSELKHT